MKLTPLLFLLSGIFLVQAMDRPQTPPIAIEHPGSPFVEATRLSCEGLDSPSLQEFMLLLQPAISSSFIRVQSLMAQHNCRIKVKAEIEQKLEILRKKLDTAQIEEQKDQLLKEYVILHYAWMYNQQNNDS